MDKNTEREIREKLKEEERKRALNKHFGENYNKYAEAAIIFFGTLGPLYFLFYLAHWVFMFNFGTAIGFLDININWIAPLIHGAIWIAAIYSVYRKRSILDDLYKRL
ncbi:MAG: hypothetical protein GVY20_17340 [Bacteroidetes bacterium]|jgi:hypothetical protein|nr:hypothetical protein [Bacteroidota bacterium]